MKSFRTGMCFLKFLEMLRKKKFLQLCQKTQGIIVTYQFLKRFREDPPGENLREVKEFDMLDTLESNPKIQKIWFSHATICVLFKRKQD